MRRIFCSKCKQEIRDIDQQKIENDNSSSYSNINVLSDEKLFWKNYKDGDSYGKWTEQWIGCFR